MSEEITKEQLADQAVEMFNALVAKLEEKAGRTATTEEMMYIREKVMLHVFGFFEREEVVIKPADEE